MSMIEKNLYLSSYADARDAREEGRVFGLVINCTKNLPPVWTGWDHQRLQIAVDDDCHEDSLDTMYRAFENVVKTMHTFISSGRSVLVHCFAGQQRSAAVVAAYLMYVHGIGCDEAMRYIKERKKDAFFWKANFEPSLRRWEAKLSGRPGPCT